MAVLLWVIRMARGPQPVIRVGLPQAVGLYENFQGNAANHHST